MFETPDDDTTDGVRVRYGRERERGNYSLSTSVKSTFFATPQNQHQRRNERKEGGRVRSLKLIPDKM